ncbi:MAG: lytic transglycosylase domain-containing protein [Rhodobacteraceae bacterium]|nr:lytic transglycosylase domain-containing protein [Paracoccaceae bacterium]
MFRVLLVGLMGLWGLVGAAALALALAQGEASPSPASVVLAQALQAVADEDWAQAAQAAEQGGPIVRDIVLWHRLRTKGGAGSGAEVLAFLARRADWPGLPLLRARSEGAFALASDDQVLRFFHDTPAQTAEGALLHAAALQRSGRESRAAQVLTDAWRGLAIDEDTHRAFLTQHAAILRPHHVARLDEMLWRGWEDNARRLLPHVDAGWQALARARLALRENRTGVDQLIAAVPRALREDPGLAFERLGWRLRRERSEAAIEMLLAQDMADAPQRWAQTRRILVREKMQQGELHTAYTIAAPHGLRMGSDFIELEWLAGYLALRLGMPETAITHFERLGEAARTPISRGRAAYWLGRAHEAQGNSALAQAAYRQGAAHQTSFYGLLAAEKSGVAFRLPHGLPQELSPRARAWERAAFTKSSVHQAALLLLEAGEPALAELFWLHLTETQNADNLARMGYMALALGQPHIAVVIGKAAARRGIVIPEPYFPLHPLMHQSLPVAPEVALAVARRESEFDPTAISHAGARGLMQLMPATAKRVAQDLSLPYSLPRLTADPAYNVDLGTAYLHQLSEEFGGNILLMAAAYNAGPHRAREWMARHGDPRRGDIDVVDWIEQIPFRETRNYVMRVAESLPIYRAHLGKTPLPVPFLQELKTSTPRH